MEKKLEFDIDQSRILVVEDNDLMRAYVTDLIESFGYSVVAATNSMDAMRAIGEDDNIAMVFTDITMPGLDGIVLADMVKQHRPQLKILYTTGGNGVSRAKSDAGVLHGNILAKPYRPDELRMEIERILS
jgi:DNA-binding NtrC family response regulator